MDQYMTNKVTPVNKKERDTAIKNFSLDFIMLNFLSRGLL